MTECLCMPHWVYYAAALFVSLSTLGGYIAMDALLRRRGR